MYYLFDTTGKYLGTCDFEPNLDDLANRGEQAIHSDLSFINPILIKGEIIDREEQPSPYHQWINGQWQISEEDQATFAIEQLEQTRERLIHQIAEKTDRLKSSVLVGYPQAEIDSFYRQESEARAWVVDNNTATPMLSAIAENRGVPLSILAQKVIEKADFVSTVMGHIIGTRQGFEDRILGAKTLEELTAYEQEIEQWQLPNH